MLPISILICDDQALIRETWAFVFSRDPRFSDVIVTASGEEAVEQAKTLRPDVVLMDINLPGMDGFEATQQIRKFSPCSKILCISMHNEPSYAKKMFQSGAMGYVSKTSHREEMFKAIFEVNGGNKYVCKEIKDLLVHHQLTHDAPIDGLKTLSHREMEVVNFVASGFTSKEIAEKLSISLKTVEIHRYNIMKKLKIRNAAALTNFVNKHRG